MFTRRQLFNILYGNKSNMTRSERTQCLINYLVKYYGIENDENAVSYLKLITSRFYSKLFDKLDSCCKKTELFLKKNEGWLNTVESSFDKALQPQPSTSRESQKCRGRPHLKFIESSDRTKRRRSERLAQKYEAEELVAATVRSLKEKGKEVAAKLVSEAVLTCPSRASKIREAYKRRQQQKEVIPLTPDQALSVMIEAKDSKHSYLIHRQAAKAENANTYPSYHKILEAKDRCYPREGQIVTETSAEILMQDLLDHTVRRILETQESVLLTIPADMRKNMVLLVKWGCDGSTGHSQYKQLFTELYYTINAAHTSFLLHEELKFYYRNITEADYSVIDHATTSEAVSVFTILTLIFSALGIFTTCLLLFGLYRDYKILLIPWIFNVVFFSVIDLTYVIYSLVYHALEWNPFAAILITLDFFLNCLNMYALLCVISQYQELKAGRGRALDDQIYRVPNVHYSSHPTATSYLSSRKPVTYYETKPTPTQSPTGNVPSTLHIPDILSPNTNRRGSRKSVKFPDNSNLTLHNGSQLLDPWSIEVKSPMLLPRGIDTAPLLEPNVPPVSQSCVRKSDLHLNSK